MTLHAIVAALGGETYQGGRRANVPAPGHSAADRSVSLLLSEGRVVVHGFGRADWRAVLDDLRARGLIDSAGRPCGHDVCGRGSGASLPPTPTRAVRIGTARTLWAGSAPILPGSTAERHLRHRRVRLPLDRLQDLRLHGTAPLSVYRGGGSTRAALVAAVRDADGELTAVELTYLDPNGRAAAGVRLPRKTIGVLPPGCAVRLSDPDPVMIVGEGVFTTLSAMARFQLPGWATLAAHNLARWTPPAGVTTVIIAADRGFAGERAAERLCRRLCAAGVAASTRLPPLPFGDWNEADGAEPGAERQGAEGRRDGGDGPRVRPAGDSP